jgi:hypothetical protein
MSFYLLPALLGSMASAQLTTTFWSPGTIDGSGKGDLQGSVVAVNNGLTTLAVSATDAVGNNWSTYETVTVGPTYFGIIESQTDESYSLGCTVTVPSVTDSKAIPTCTDSIVGIGIGNSCGDESGDDYDYEKRGRTAFNGYPVPTAIAKRQDDGITCTSGTEITTSTGVSVYIYTVILTAGTDKLTATGTASNSATGTASTTGTAKSTDKTSNTASNKASATTSAANTASPSSSADASSSSTISTRTTSGGSLDLHVPIAGVVLALVIAIAL